MQELDGNSQYIAEYLALEVLSRQHPDVKKFLLETSILDRFCAPLCRAVHSSGVGERNQEQEFDPQSVINWLVDSNLFVIALDDRGYWFRYHHLFQAFLKGELRKQRTADRIADLQRIASNWFAENGLVDEAIRHALAAGDVQAAVQLVVDHRYHLLNTSQFTLLLQWLRWLPPNAVAETPLLLMTKAFLGFELGPDSDAYTYREQAYRKADELPTESPDASMLSGELALMQSLQDVIMGQPVSAAVHAQKTLQLLPRPNTI